MPFNCKYAIFDNDGTLMESMYYWRLAGIEYMIAHRLPIPGEMTLREMFSHSSRAFSEDIARTQQAGMNAHISKPIDFNVLEQVLGRLLAAPSNRQESEP